MIIIYSSGFCYYYCNHSYKSRVLTIIVFIFLTIDLCAIYGIEPMETITDESSKYFDNTRFDGEQCN